jgi:hypothetical protein
MTSVEEERTIELYSKSFQASRKYCSNLPHYVGSANHDQVANYLQAELQKLGLETSTQEGYTLTDWGNLVKSKIF